ncbi:hypothetical protein K457DRAFT_20292 [Linnemannia elongata AG-77]|uniref:Uncharacterized protein n=1 Tax=Linnemannia elongata AG-77 TaxID=1314771 RepID=A0A197JTP2_9FUNG|nr:hypothetical protein K457DRAFT_20292 [Linnemannia elongata AG-77]
MKSLHPLDILHLKSQALKSRQRRLTIQPKPKPKFKSTITNSAFIVKSARPQPQNLSNANPDNLSKTRRIISNSRGNAVEFSQLVDGDNIQEFSRVIKLRAATMTNVPLEVWETKLLCFGATSKKRYLVAEWLFEGVAEWNGDAGRGRRRKKMSNVDRRIPLRFGGGFFELDILKV